VQQGDGQWAALEPLVEAARPKGKTRPRDLRRTLEAIVWRHRNGATWRAIPAELGPWWRAAQLFIRWAELGAWQRLLETAQGRGVELGVAFLDGTSAQRDRREALGRSRGGFGTKACVVADGRGRAVAFALAPGQAHELPLAPGLLDRLPRVPLWVVGDRGYSSDAFRDLVWGKGARPAIPTRSNEAAVACPDYIYNNRSLVERLWGRLEEWRAVATRYEKTAAGYLGVLCLAATMDWLKP
jgi:transposase